jgi:hypothetical protein
MSDETKQLRAALAEALDIAEGSGADFTWQARGRLKELRALTYEPAAFKPYVGPVNLTGTYSFGMHLDPPEAEGPLYQIQGEP